MMDVIASAVKHEKEAINLYKYLSEEASLASLKRLFASILMEKQRHLERINNFQLKPDDYDTHHSDKYEFSTLFPQIVKDKGIEGLCKDEVDFYMEVMECEKNGINRYEHYLHNASDEKSKKLLADIMLQERKHFNIVKGLCVFISEQHSLR